MKHRTITREHERQRRQRHDKYFLHVDFYILLLGLPLTEVGACKYNVALVCKNTKSAVGDRQREVRHCPNHLPVNVIHTTGERFSRAVVHRLT